MTTFLKEITNACLKDIVSFHKLNANLYFEKFLDSKNPHQLQIHLFHKNQLEQCLKELKRRNLQKNTIWKIEGF